MPRIPIPQVEQTVGADGPLQAPVARGGQLGDYASQADQGLARVASQSAYYAELRENDQAMSWANNAASTFKLQQFDKFKDGQDSAAPGADGFTKTYIESYNNDANDLLAQAPTPRAKKFLTNHLDTFKVTMGEKAKMFEAEQGYDYRETQYTQSVKNSGQLVYQDPSQYASELTTLRQTAANLQTHPNFRAKAADMATRELTDQYWASKSQTDPQGTVNELRAGVPASAQPGSGIPEQIKTEATKQGVDPRAALIFAQIESSMKPDAKNGSSVGLFQLGKDVQEQYGVTDPLDAAQNMQGGIGYMADNTKAFRSTLKRDPSVSELYAMHLLGTGGGMALAKADDNRSFDEFARKLYAEQLKKNPNYVDQVEAGNRLQGMSVGQVKDTLANWTNKAANETAGMAAAPATTEDAQANASSNPAVANLSLPDRMKWLTHAQNLLRKDDTQEKAQLGQQVKDTIAGYSEGQDGPRPDRGEVLRIAGPVQGALINRDLDGWQGFAHDYAQGKMLGPDEQAQFLKERVPQPGDDYAGRKERFDRLAGAFDKINTARRTDLIGWDQTSGGHVTQDIDWTQPLAYSGPLAGRFQQADQLSKQYQVPFQAFKQSDVNTLGPMLEHAPPQQAVDVLRQIHASADSEDHYQKAIAQLAPNHPSLAVAGSLPEVGYAGIQNPAQYILKGEQVLRPDKPDKAGEGKTPGVLLPEDKPGGFRDNWDKTVGGAFPSSLSSNQYLNAAIAYYVGKQDPAKRSHILDQNLWNEAVNVVAPSVQWNSGKVLVPQGVYPNGFKDTVNKVWPQVMQQYGLDPAEHNATSYPLKNTPDGKYAVTNGTTALYGANGYPVVFGLDGSVPNMEQPTVQPPPEAKLPKLRDPLQLPMKKTTR